MNKEQKGNCLLVGIVIGIVVILLIVYFIEIKFSPVTGNRNSNLFLQSGSDFLVCPGYSANL